MREGEIVKEAVVQRRAVHAGPREPCRDGRVMVPEYAHGGADRESFGQGRQHFRNSVGSGFEPIERCHPEGTRGAC
jgi:hypothetical protein